jgi:hypothetical protein
VLTSGCPRRAAANRYRAKDATGAGIGGCKMKAQSVKNIIDEFAGAELRLEATITILDCTPQMADVLSSAVPRPRGRKSQENKFRYLTRQTPAWKRVEVEFGFDVGCWPTIQHRPDLAPPAHLGLPSAETYLLIWEALPTETHGSRGMVRILTLNEDGTHCALIDPLAELARQWASAQQHRDSQSARAKGKSGPKRKPVEQLSATQRWRRNKETAAEASPVRSSDYDPNDRNGQSWVPANPYNK